jgi:Flp pilus assembly protein TadG
MSKNQKRSRRGERGQALVEFALILPIILLVMVGMLEFARAWNLHQVMTDAAREGARRAAIQDVGLGHEQTQDSVKKAMWVYLSQAGYDPKYSNIKTGTPAPITMQGPGGSGTGTWKKTGDFVVVTLACPYRFAILPTRPITMRTSFTMRVE